jgi:hypothetical protein
MTGSKIDIFAENIYRNSVFIEKLNLGFAQFFVKTGSGSVLCIETGMREGFPQLKSNLLSAGIDIESVSSVIVPHFEADEMGALPDFLAHNKNLVAYAHPICSHALADIFSVKTKIADYDQRRSGHPDLREARSPVGFSGGLFAEVQSIALVGCLHALRSVRPDDGEYR